MGHSPQDPFRINVSDAICLGGGHGVNEDAHGRYQSRFWVLDGAGGGSAPLVRRFSEALAHDYGDLPLKSICAKAMGRVSDAGHAGYDQNAASFAMVMARIDRDWIEISCLSDCAAILWRGDKCEVYTDGRINKITKRTGRVINHVKNLVENGDMPDHEGKALVMRQIAKNKRMMNRPGGYYVGDIGGAAFKHAENWRVSTRDVSQIILCSDGFMRLFDYQLMTMHEFFTNGVTLDHAAEILRLHERAMPAWTEIKRHDDITAVRIQHIYQEVITNEAIT